MAIQGTDLLIAYRPTDQAHYKLSVADLPSSGGGANVIVSDTTPDPDSYSEGQLWWNSDSDFGSLFVLYNDPSGGAGGDTGGKKWVQASPTIILDENGDPIDINGDYLKTNVDAGDQVVLSTGTTTFSGLTEHGGGVKVTGGSSASVEAGIAATALNLSLISDSEEIASLSARFGVAATTQKNSNYTSATNITLFPGLTAGNTINDYRCINVIPSGGGNQGTVTSFSAYTAASTLTDFGNTNYGYLSALTTGSNNNFNFYAVNNAPNFFAGNTYIGGNTTRNTRELWESTLTEEQKEELTAGTLVVPANVAIPGDGEFVRQWWYDQQSEEDQALIDAGELEYPEQFQAANFVDTFDLNTTTNTRLLSNGVVSTNNRYDAGGDVLSAVGSQLSAVGRLRLSRKSNANVLETYDGVDSTVRCALTANGDFTGGLGEFSGGVKVTGDSDSSNLGLVGDYLNFKNNESGSAVTGVGAISMAFVGTVSASATDAFGIISQFAFSGDYTKVAQFNARPLSSYLNNGSADESIGFLADSNIAVTNAATAIGFQSNIDGPTNYNFYASGTAPNFFEGDITCNGLINGAFSLRMESDNPAAFQTSYSTDEEGNQIENQTYVGTTEDLLTIIKDLRARVEALEAAATA